MFFVRMNRTNLTMIERRGGTRFSLKTLQCRSISGEFVGQEVQGHAASELDVLSLVDHAHTAASYDLKHSIMGDLLAGQSLFVAGRRNRALGFHFLCIL